MFSSELQLSPATVKLFHLEQFAIYGIIVCLLFIDNINNGSLPGA